jgi:hydroxymethylpyrimidine/phosphomethylpyrimidine kinase
MGAHGSGRGERPFCLAIGGFDPSGGAGVLADAAAIAAAGARPLAAVAVLTVQTHRAFRAALAPPASFLARQVEELLDAYPVRAVKIGALPGPAHVRAVASVLRGRRLRLVVDPVLSATRGPGLVRPAARAALVRRLAPLAALLTPNAAEASAFAGLPVRTLEDAARAGEAMREQGWAAVLVKGGHLAGARSVVRDVLVSEAGATFLPGLPAIGIQAHGAGCTLAAAIAAGLAGGLGLAGAIRGARDLVQACFADASRRRSGWGPDCLGWWAASRPLRYARGWWLRRG